MPIFTAIADYKGGTYLAQVTAETPLEASVNWAKGELQPIRRFGSRSRQKLEQDLIGQNWAAGLPMRMLFAEIGIIVSSTPDNR